MPRRDADALLRRGFPYGATVMLDGTAPFVSLRYEVTEVDRVAGVVELRFERDPGDTLQTVSLDQLERAALTGRLDLTRGRVRRPESADGSSFAWPFTHFVGPQSSGDDPFRARLRLHQSWWRTFRLRVPFGTGPARAAATPYGNMLRPEHGDVGLNFCSPEAHTAFRGCLAVRRTGVKAWDTAHNLLTSQTMCFNVFGHLRQHPDLAAAFFTDILGEHLGSAVDGIELEHHSDAIRDRTAFDAYALRADAGAVAIETKLTEPFSQQQYDWHRYLRTCAAATGRWNTTDPSVLGNRKWSQLWRNHLLAVAEHLRTIGHQCGNRADGCRDAHPGGGSSWPKVMVVHHPLDAKCIAAVDGYRGLLAEPDDVVRVDLQGVVDSLRRLAGDDPRHCRWIDRLEERYLRLDLSEPLLRLAPN